jgi:hypothetical protein
MARTPDTAFLQCLVGFPDDVEYTYHHRILLVAGPDGQWIWVTPTGSVQRGRIRQDDDVVPLRRNALFPAEHAGNIFAFDAIPEAELDEYYQEAVAFARIVGFDVIAAPARADELWFVCDATSDSFGEPISREVYMDEAVCHRHGDVGCLDLAGLWVSIVRVGKGCARGDGIPTWEEFKSRGSIGASRDERLLGNDRDRDGVRYLNLRDTIDRVSEVPLRGFPLKGKRATKETLLALRDAGQTSFDDHNTVFCRQSGIGDKTNLAREHRLICRVLRMLHQYDQCDITNLAAAELLVRRMLQLEAATRRNPRAPDFEGLDVILDSAIDEHGCAVVPEFSGWVASLQKSEAATLKEARFWRDEQDALRKRNKGGGRDKEKGGE